MRFSVFIEKIFAVRMRDKVNDAYNAAYFTQGGWEVWAQIETAFQVFVYGEANERKYEFIREVQFPGDPPGRCDFVINPERAVDTRTWIELKVELRAGADDLARRFFLDVGKIEAHAGQFPVNNSGGAVSYAVWNANTYLQALRRDLTQYQRDQYRYIAFADSRDAIKSRSLGDNANLPSDQNAVVVYRDLINLHNS